MQIEYPSGIRVNVMPTRDSVKAWEKVKEEVEGKKKVVKKRGKSKKPK